MNRKSPFVLKLLWLEKKLQLPMLFLSFVWLCILIIELAYTENPILLGLGTSIWILYIIYLTMRLITAANRITFLKRNWLFVSAILVTALRFFPYLQSFPVLRVITATFGIQVIWIFASADQGLRLIRRYLGRRGVGYAIALTLVVVFAGAAGMLSFERESGDPQSLQSYPRALWWAAMQMTNIGSSYSVKTTEGRILCLAISIYAAAMFGYLTALIATFFIDRDAFQSKQGIAQQESLQLIQQELLQLRRLIEKNLKKG
jgi:voltage-gated potassium channel